MFFNLKIPDHY